MGRLIIIMYDIITLDINELKILCIYAYSGYQ